LTICETAFSSKTQHQESGSGGKKEENDRAPSQAHAHGFK
jgi:hypothetical protein